MVMKKEKRWRWNKEVIVIFGLAMFLLAVSIAYAGVLNYYGKIVGTANVQGPIFYADFHQNKLLINVKPSTTETVSFSDSSSTFIFTDDIGSVSFNYRIGCAFSMKAWSNSDNQQLRVYCRYWDGTWHDLCYADITVSTTPTIITALCSLGPASLTNVRRFGYKFEGQSPDSSVTYYIESNPNGDTRFQLINVG